VDGKVAVSAPTLDPALHLVLRGTLALLWLSAAWHKARDPARFRAALEGYGILRARPVAVAARAVPVLEGAVGLALCVPALGAAPAVAAAALLAAYTAVIALGLARGRRGIDCGCGGLVAGQRLRPALLVRNAVWIAIALVAALPAGTRPLVPLDALTVAGGVAALALLAAAVDLALAHGPGLRGLAERA
jgi:hypothetical protein